MSTLDLINRAAAAGIQLACEGGRLTYKAPQSAAPLLAELREHRNALIAALTPPPQPRPEPVARGTCVYGCPDARLYICGWRCETHRPKQGGSS